MRFPKQIPVLTGIRRFSYVAGLAAFLFVTLSLGASHQKRNWLPNVLSASHTWMTTASGLLWLSELIEEHTKLAKILGKKCIYVRE